MDLPIIQHRVCFVDQKSYRIPGRQFFQLSRPLLLHRLGLDLFQPVTRTWCYNVTLVLLSVQQDTAKFYHLSHMCAC